MLEIFCEQVNAFRYVMSSLVNSYLSGWNTTRIALDEVKAASGAEINWATKCCILCR